MSSNSIKVIYYYCIDRQRQEKLASLTLYTKHMLKSTYKITLLFTSNRMAKHSFRFYTFTLNRFTSGDVIHFIYKIFCLTHNWLLFKYKTTLESNTPTIFLWTKQTIVKPMHYNSVAFIFSRVSGSSNRKLCLWFLTDANWGLTLKQSHLRRIRVVAILAE